MQTPLMFNPAQNQISANLGKRQIQIRKPLNFAEVPCKRMKIDENSEINMRHLHQNASSTCATHEY